MILYHIHEKQSNIPFLSFFNCWLERENTTLLQKEQEKTEHKKGRKYYKNIYNREILQQIIPIHSLSCKSTYT